MESRKVTQTNSKNKLISLNYSCCRNNLKSLRKQLVKALKTETDIEFINPKVSFLFDNFAYFFKLKIIPEVIREMQKVDLVFGKNIISSYS